jgi:S1-C subfamily serine protease
MLDLRTAFHELEGDEAMSTYNTTYSPRSRSAYQWPLILLLMFTGLLLWRFSPAFSFRPARMGLNPTAEPRVIAARGDLAEDEKATIELFKQSSPSVVHITTISVRQDRITLDLLQIPQGTGSGFVWDQDGHIVTNYHVVQGADAAQVTLADQSTWKARLVGAYPDKDLAVLVIDAPKDGLVPILVGTSQDLSVGQKVFAIGNPFGLDHSLTTGVISALGREIESVSHRTIKDMIQTDAAINPGNSGGPLLDSAGRLIGVNAAIYSPSGAYAGIGFAIPVDEVNRVVPKLIREGKVTRVGLGVQIAPDQLVKQLGLKGILILGVQPGSPAARAGLEPTRRGDDGQIHLGDLIVAIDGQRVETVNQLLDVLDQHASGDKVEVTVSHDGKERKVTVSLEPIS